MQQDLREVMVTITAADPLETVVLERLCGPHRRGVQVLTDRDLAGWSAANADGDVVTASRMASGGVVLWDRSWWLERTTCGFAVLLPYPDNGVTREAMERMLAPGVSIDELELSLQLLDLERQRRGLNFPAAARLDAQDGSVADSDLTGESTRLPAPALQ